MYMYGPYVYMYAYIVFKKYLIMNSFQMHIDVWDTSLTIPPLKQVLKIEWSRCTQKNQTSCANMCIKSYFLT